MALAPYVFSCFSLPPQNGRIAQFVLIAPLAVILDNLQRLARYGGNLWHRAG